MCIPAACRPKPTWAKASIGNSRTAGAALQARVLRVDGDQVTIERRDGKRFTVAIGGFSPADQEFLRGLGGRKAQETPGDDWPQFRGPGGLGISRATGLPVTWSAQENVVWKTALPGPGGSSPIVIGDRIFVTCYSGYGIQAEQPGQMENLKRHLVCLNRAMAGSSGTGR